MAEDVMETDSSNNPEFKFEGMNEDCAENGKEDLDKYPTVFNGSMNSASTNSNLLKASLSPSMETMDGRRSPAFNNFRKNPQRIRQSSSSSSSDSSIGSKLSPPVLGNSILIKKKDLISNNKTHPMPVPLSNKTIRPTSPFSLHPSLIKPKINSSLPNDLQQKSAFRRKLQMPSPNFLETSLTELNEDNVLKRCNSAPMLNDISDGEDQAPWSIVNPTNTRLRRFSATVVSVNSSPSSGISKGNSRLHQLKKEESLEAIQFKEAAHEREVQVAMQMNSTCEELSLNDSHNSLESSNEDRSEPSPLFVSSLPSKTSLHSPQPLPVKPSSNRAIDFGRSVTSQSSPVCFMTSHHPGVPSPLSILPFGNSVSPMPPSPTRVVLPSVGKQCFSPSMQIPVLRDGSLSPSPSPTRRSFVTRRRSQSPCLRPSVLGPIKRKYDSDSESCSSPKRPMISMTTPGIYSNQSNDTTTINSAPPFTRTVIHRSHSLSSSSVDSDLNVSPSPPQIFHNSFLPMGVQFQHRRNTSSPIQSPLCNTSLPVPQDRLCSSPTSSTCSSSSLEGLKDLPLFPPTSQTLHLPLQSKNHKNVTTNINRVQRTSDLAS